jgi:hypothetical protein
MCPWHNSSSALLLVNLGQARSFEADEVQRVAVEGPFDDFAGGAGQVIAWRRGRFRPWPTSAETAVRQTAMTGSARVPRYVQPHRRPMRDAGGGGLERQGLVQTLRCGMWPPVAK